MRTDIKIGVLAVQGAFIEHEHMLNDLGVQCVEIRKKEDLDNIDGIILPGGESTVQGQLLIKLGIMEPLRKMIENGLPVLATCAGLILLAKHIDNDSVTHIATLPVTVKRNAYGRQLGSFNTTANIEHIGDYPMVFIRAPYVKEVEEGVEILATVDNNIVAVKYKNQIGLAFHPELTGDTSIHKHFIDTILMPGINYM